MKKKKFRVESLHIVNVDSYTEGEGEYVNEYSVESNVSAENPMGALKEHCKNHIFIEFKKENFELDDEDSNLIRTCYLVDTDNMKATEEQIERWKKNEQVLYSNYTSIRIYELTPMDLSDITK